MNTRRLWLVAGCVCAMLFVSAGPALAAVYDFESLGTGSIDGKDGWSSNGLNGYTTTPGGYPSAGSGICVTTYGGTGTSYGARPNDTNWGYDLSGGGAFSMGAAIRVDYQVSGYYGNAEMLLTISASGRSIGFGYEVLPWYYSPYIMDATGTENNLGNLGMAKGTAVDMLLNVDPTANGGSGLATLWANKNDAGWIQYGAATDLKLVKTGDGAYDALISQADGVRLEVKTRLGAIDDIFVTVIPEPATVSLLVIGAVGLIVRRRRRGRA